MQPGDINFVDLPPPDMPARSPAGAIDAYFVGEPHAAKAELDGTGRVLYHAKDIWPRFVSCVLVVREELIAEHPEIVRDLVRGIAESGEWAEHASPRGSEGRRAVLPPGREAARVRADAAAGPRQLPPAHADRRGHAADHEVRDQGRHPEGARSTSATSVDRRFIPSRDPPRRAIVYF